MKFIYIAGPYSSDPVGNTAVALEIYSDLIDAGFWPYVPHLSHFAPAKDYRVWMDLDFAWIRRCDALLRLPGKSPGADEEVALAHEIGLPCFLPADLDHALDDLLAWAKP